MHCPHVVLGLTFGLTFTFAVIVTVDKFRDINREWERGTCTLASNDFSKVDDCESNSRYFGVVRLSKIEINGTEVELDSFTFYKDGVVTAGETSLTCSYNSEEEASEYIGQFSAGQRVNCYTNRNLVRLTEGGWENSQSDNLKKQAALSMIAALAALLALVYVVYMIRNRGRMTQRMPSSGRRGVARVVHPGQVFRRPVTVDETKAFLMSMPDTHSGGSCPICLEDFDADSRTARTLPCNHAYHEECAMQWFAKGNVKCPYCFHDYESEVLVLRKERNSERKAETNSSTGG